MSRRWLSLLCPLVCNLHVDAVILMDDEALSANTTGWRKVMPAQGEGIDKTLTKFRSYHNSEAIFKKLRGLEDDCAVPLVTEWVKDKKGEGALFVARVGQDNAEKRLLVAANEHAREMLTAEVALRFVEMACKKPSSSFSLIEEQKMLTSLEGVQFIITPVINQKGRELVEMNKEPCQRMTIDDEGGVDLNRNMDVDWAKGSPQPWGKEPFSQYQSRILRDLAQEHKPVAYLDLHTGMQSLMTSWGFKHAVTSDYKDQEKLLKVIKEKHCPNCPIGPNSVVVGYENPGEVIDHMYAKEGIKYSTLWELYGGSGGDCIEEFNPKDGEYEKQVSNWANSLFSLGSYIHKNVDKDEKSQPDVVDWKRDKEDDSEEESSFLELRSNPMHPNHLTT